MQKHKTRKNFIDNMMSSIRLLKYQMNLPLKTYLKIFLKIKIKMCIVFKMCTCIQGVREICYYFLLDGYTA